MLWRLQVYRGGHAAGGGAVDEARGKQQGAAASPADNETVLVDGKTMVLGPAEVAAYNRAMGHKEEDEPVAED